MSFQRFNETNVVKEVGFNVPEYSSHSGNLPSLHSGKLHSWQEMGSQIHFRQPPSQFPDLNENNYSSSPLFNDKICLMKGDITDLNVEVIVNSTHFLTGETGVDGAILNAGGSNLRTRCILIPKFKISQVEVTSGYDLRAQYIYHTIAPQYSPDALGAENLLRKCYEHCLDKLLEQNLSTIAFPCIGTGGKKFPIEVGARVALQSLRLFLEKHAYRVNRIIICTHNDASLEAYLRLIRTYFPVD